MPPAFHVKDFLTIPEVLRTKSLPVKTEKKYSVIPEFNTKFCCRKNLLEEINAFHNIAFRALTNSYSYTKIIGICGEGGIGKSRLVYELLKKISNYNFSNIIKVNYSDKNNLIFCNEFEKLKDLFDKYIKDGYKKNFPIVVVMEDFHWYESQEKKKIEKLLFAFSGELPIPFKVSVIFVITYREGRSAFNFRNYNAFEEINLKPFTEEESKEFINSSKLVNKKSFTEDSIHKIIALSAGNSFYLEEFIKSFIINKKSENLPSSIENLLTFKLSFIKDDTLKILEIIAACDGMVEKDLLSNICQKLRLPFSDDNELTETGLIRVEIKSEKLNYAFIHDIYKNFIYESISKDSKLLINKLIAELFEREFSKSEAMLYRLFYHNKNAEEYEKAFFYLEEYIKKIIEHREYEVALQRINELIEYHSNSKNRKLEIWLLKVKCLRELLKRDEMGIEIKKIGKIINYHKSSELYLNYLFYFEEFLFLSNDFTAAFRIINKGLKLSREQKNVKSETMFQFLLTRNLNTTGKINECLKQAEVLLKLSRVSGQAKYHYWAKYFIAINLQSLQNYDEANKIIDEYIEKTKEETDMFFLGRFNAAKAKYYFRINNYSKFIELTREQYKIDLKINVIPSSIVNLLNLCDCLILTGNLLEAEEILNSLLTFVNKNSSLLFKKRILEGLLLLKLGSENFQEAEIISIELLNLYDKNDLKNIAEVCSNLIIIHFYLKNLKKSEQYFKMGVYYSKKTNNVSNNITNHFNMGYAYYLSDNIIDGEKLVRKSFLLSKDNLRLSFNFEISFALAEIHLVQGNFLKAKKILDLLLPIFQNSKQNQYSLFFVTFHKLLINIDPIEKFEEFLGKFEFSNFLMDAQVDYVSKIKIIYFILILDKDKYISSKKIRAFMSLINNKNKKENKTISFYLNKIKKYNANFT